MEEGNFSWEGTEPRPKAEDSVKACTPPGNTSHGEKWRFNPARAFLPLQRPSTGQRWEGQDLFGEGEGDGGKMCEFYHWKLRNLQDPGPAACEGSS